MGPVPPYPARTPRSRHPDTETPRARDGRKGRRPLHLPHPPPARGRGPRAATRARDAMLRYPQTAALPAPRCSGTPRHPPSPAPRCSGTPTGSRLPPRRDAAAPPTAPVEPRFPCTRARVPQRVDANRYMAPVSAHSPRGVPSSGREPLRNGGFCAVANHGVRECTETGVAGIGQTPPPAAATPGSARPPTPRPPGGRRRARAPTPAAAGPPPAHRRTLPPPARIRKTLAARWGRTRVSTPPADTAPVPPGCAALLRTRSGDSLPASQPPTRGRGRAAAQRGRQPDCRRIRRARSPSRD
jgi:hypothetical protein